MHAIPLAPTTRGEAKINGTSKVEPATSMTCADTVAGNNLGNHRSDEIRRRKARLGDGDLADDVARESPTPNHRAVPAAAGWQ